MARPKYKVGDQVKVEGTNFAGVIAQITISTDPGWPHKYKVRGRNNTLTFDEGSIVKKRSRNG